MSKDVRCYQTELCMEGFVVACVAAVAVAVGRRSDAADNHKRNRMWLDWQSVLTMEGRCRLQDRIGYCAMNYSHDGLLGRAMKKYLYTAGPADQSLD